MRSVDLDLANRHTRDIILRMHDDLEIGKGFRKSLVEINDAFNFRVAYLEGYNLVAASSACVVNAPIDLSGQCFLFMGRLVMRLYGLTTVDASKFERPTDPERERSAGMRLPAGHVRDVGCEHIHARD